jgi:menaquinone-dependent protoporphyrinogen oxidase
VPNVLITVSLAIASKFADEVAEACGFPNTLTGETKWEPANLHNAAGALKYVECDFFRRWIMWRIAEHEGGPTDVSQDHELTDWKALETFVTGFLSSLKV